ncbi:hypothetical protein [Cytobacillus firmus]|uniref:hypothetical protein n=1 Tax=Cytobacillus firmus TaxID=1399 RepID=UPI0024C12C84|nr:hypothetical protein [Cytobacillus firmus]WHY63658.1 hypothetical protein QNH42_09930 [Cytobacillus firmus]
MGSIRVEFKEFFAPNAGRVNEEEAHEICYTRALIELTQKGIKIKSFDIGRSSELAMRRWENERMLEQDYKMSFQRSVKDALNINHEGGTE